MYDRLTLNVPAPDLVIYLQAPVDVLMQRIIERGRDFERPINRDYLKKISDAYVEFFYYYATSPLLIVNTQDFDLAGKQKDYDLLLEHIRQLPPGRHFFNPKK